MFYINFKNQIISEESDQLQSFILLMKSQTLQNDEKIKRQIYCYIVRSLMQGKMHFQAHNDLITRPNGSEEKHKNPKME